MQLQHNERQKREQLGNIRTGTATPTDTDGWSGACRASATSIREWLWPENTADILTGKADTQVRPGTRKCVTWLTICRTQAKLGACDRGHTGRKVLRCKQCSKTKEKLKRRGRKKENTLRSRLSRCKSSAPLMSWRMKISLYSPKLSRSSQAATSSVPQFWTTKVKSKTPLISTCAMQSQSRGWPQKMQDRQQQR